MVTSGSSCSRCDCSNHLTMTPQHFESMPKPTAACMLAILRLTSAYLMFGHRTKLIFCLYLCIQLSQLLCNPLRCNPGQSISPHAVNMLSLYVYNDLYDPQAGCKLLHRYLMGLQGFGNHNRRPLVRIECSNACAKTIGLNHKHCLSQRSRNKSKNLKNIK